MNTNWIETNNGLYRKLVFTDFANAFAFMAKVAVEAEKMHHHPKWTNTWNTVEIWLITHDAGNTITAADHLLSEKIDALL